MSSHYAHTFNFVQSFDTKIVITINTIMQDAIWNINMIIWNMQTISIKLQDNFLLTFYPRSV